MLIDGRRNSIKKTKSICFKASFQSHILRSLRRASLANEAFNILLRICIMGYKGAKRHLRKPLSKAKELTGLEIGRHQAVMLIKAQNRAVNSIEQGFGFNGEVRRNFSISRHMADLTSRGAKHSGYH